jgi:hypothetical protein
MLNFAAGSGALDKGKIGVSAGFRNDADRFGRGKVIGHCTTKKLAPV